ncbi:MAG: hypothetical protein U1D41_16185 [Nitrosomonas sp.]|uniref:beta strand repeat-containing protein n=1 Tax=Nitrosomonas sp. TaxID=42353 RepID=UPI0027375936|nr:hypothetical protein [Nitrosomonas sp.]MDP3662789.1 hypothetical protein [Nitrosomonas sp.]MDZ4107654.1 hypothetical protein [Nitrosomonas sp.]
MAITSTQKTEILKIVAGLFNAAPGGSNLTELANLVSGGMTTSQLADALAANTLFTNGIMGGKVTVEDQAGVLAHNFGLAADSDPASAGSQAVAYFTQLINDGVGFGNIVFQAVTYLSGTPATEFTDAATLLANKALVADAYSKTASSTDLDTLQGVLSEVPGDHALTAEEVAALIGEDPDGGTPGTTFTLTGTTDALTGTANNDIFIGDNSSASAGDTLVGGGGTDTLKLFGTAIVPNFSGIEQVYYNAPGAAIDLSAKSGVTSIELDGFGTQTLTVGKDQAVKLTNQNGGTATIAGNSPTTLGLTLNNAEGATVALTGTGLTQLDVTASGNDSDITLTNAGAKLETINIAGSKALDLTHALTTVKTINAGTATGDVTISGVGASVLAFTGGKGNDKIAMGATVAGTDVLKGGEGTDTLSVSDADTIDTAAEVIGITEFETFEAAGVDATAYNLAIIGAKNTLTGLVISATGGAATVSNINAATTGNISITGAAPTTITLTAVDFVSGGTSDTTTISLDNSETESGTGIDVTSLVFANADIINLKSIGDGSSTKTVGGAEENSVILTATDAEKVVITGDEALSFATAAGTNPTEIDASGLTNDAAVTIDTDASAITSLLAKGTGKNDTIDIDNAATVTSTLYLGGGSDTVTVDGGGTSAHTLIYTATALNAGDIKAGDSSTLALTGVAAGDTVTINFSSALEALLKSGSTLLSATGANINVHGTTISATTNIAAAQAAGTMTIQIDVNGDGAYAAADDYQLTITGTGTDDTLIYNAAADTLIFTVV